MPSSCRLPGVVAFLLCFLLSVTVATGRPPLDRHAGLPQASAPVEGHSPADAILSRDGNWLYVVSPITHSILILDTRTDTVASAIELDQANPPGYWPLRLVLSPDGSRLYSANWLSQSVSVIDTGLNRVVGAVQLSGAVHDVAVTSDGNFLCVELLSDRVIVVDARSLTVSRTVRLDASDSTYSIAAAPNSGEVCVASQPPTADPSANSRVYCINPASGAIVARIEVGRQVTNQGRLGFTADGSKILLPCGSAGSSALYPSRGVNKVYVIGRSERRLLKEIPVEGGPTVLRVAPDGTVAFVVSSGDIYVLDLAALTVKGKLDWSGSTAASTLSTTDVRDATLTPTGKLYLSGGDVDGIFTADFKTLRVTGFIPVRARSLAACETLLSPDGKTLYVASQLPDGNAKGSLFLVDVASRSVKAETIPGIFPTSPARGPKSGSIYVASGRTLLVVSPDSGRIEQEIQVDKQQGYYGVAISPDEQRAYLTSWNNPYLAVVDLHSGTTIQQVEVGPQPQMVRITRDGSTLIVSRRDNSRDHGGLVFIDAASLKVTATIDPPEGVGAVGRLDLLVISPDQRMLYWGTHADFIHVIDLASRKLVKTIDFRKARFPYPDTGIHPSDMVFSPDGAKAYVSCGDSHWVAVVDLAQNDVADYFYSVGIDPSGIAISPAGDVLYVICEHEVVVLDVRTKQRTARIPLAFGQQLSFKGVVNAASMVSGRTSPGEVAVLFGSGLGPADLAAASAVEGRMPTSLAGLTVTVDGLPAPVLYARSDQSAIVVPFESCSQSTAQVEVVYGGKRTSVAVPVNQVNPGLFTLNGSGKGQAAALNENGTYNGPAAPARPGEIVVLFATGLGRTQTAVTDGQLAAAPYPLAQTQVRVTIGGQSGEILYAGAAPGLVLGVFQINVRVPHGIEAGDSPVTLGAGGVNSQAGVTVRVLASP